MLKMSTLSGIVILKAFLDYGTINPYIYIFFVSHNISLDKDAIYEQEVKLTSFSLNISMT